jgi:SulP family sulfate permease
MVVAVSVGIVLAALLFMRRMAELTRVSLVGEGHAPGPGSAPADLPKGVAVYEIAGPLFFGAAQKATSQMRATGGLNRVLIIRLDAVPAMDATGLVALESALGQLVQNGCRVILCGLQPQPAKLLQRARIQESPGKLAIRPDLPAAVAHAREIVESAPSQTPNSAL